MIGVLFSVHLYLKFVIKENFISTNWNYDDINFIRIASIQWTMRSWSFNLIDIFCGFFFIQPLIHLFWGYFDVNYFQTLLPHMLAWPEYRYPVFIIGFY